MPVAHSPSDYRVDNPASLRSIISRIEQLPVLPAVALQALKLSLLDDVNLDHLARLMESDPVLTARILRLVNNAQTGLPKRISTVKQAVTLAGLTQVRCALLGVLVKEYLPGGPQQLAVMSRQMWTHSLVTAILAGLIAERTFPELRETAFVGGLLHDIGKMAIMDVFPEIAVKIDEIRREKRLDAVDAEQRILETNHCTVGKILVEQWNLPEQIVECIWLHHHRVEAMSGTSLNWELPAVVSLANLLTLEMFCETPMQNGEDPVTGLLTALSLTREEMADLRRRTSQEYEKKAVYFDLESDLSMVFHEIIQQANHKLSGLGIELDSKNSALSKINTLLSMNGKLGLELANVRGKADLFQGIAQAFAGLTAVQVGIFYLIDQVTRELEGIVWVDGGKKRKLLCFTKRNGEPVWERDAQNLPPDLRRVLGESRHRMHGSTDITQSISNPFVIFSFGEERSYFAELCISLSQDFRTQDGQLLAGFTQVVQIIRSSLERIRLFENLQAKKEDLALALWKTQQISQQLIQTERLAAVGQLAAGAAHEINNPLAIISARAQLLELREQDEKRKKELALITEQIERISKILTNLMEFARPAPPNLRSMNIHDILDRVLELVGGSFPKFQITLERQYDPRMRPIKADPNQLEQVFLNLIINAQHAMEQDGGVLTVATEYFPDQQVVVIRIVDQGIGIAKENQKKIFDPFFSTKDEGKGTGLGLSTSLGIINNHFGRIDLESAPGEGTIFRVELPVDISALRPTKPETAGNPSMPLSLRPRVLVMDDEEHIRDVLKEALENEGIDVETAENGKDGRDILEQERFDLLLLDIKMPLRDGLSVMRDLRTSKTNAELPVIAITGTATHEEMAEIANHGGKCIRKPFHIKHLLTEVRDSLRQTDG